MIADIRKLIHDAWEFFVPSSVRLAAALIVFAMLCGTTPFTRAAVLFQSHTYLFTDPNIIKVLDTLKLTALVPFFALLLVAAVFYASTRIIYGIATLLPCHVTYSMGNPIISMFSETWKRIPEARNVSELLEIVTLLIGKAKAEGRSELLSSLDAWEKKHSDSAQLFNLAKFFVFWTCTCAVLALSAARPIGLVLGHTLLLLIGFCGLAAFAACRQAYDWQQVMYMKAHIVSVLLSLEGQAAVSDTDPRERRISEALAGYETYGDRGWWSISWGVMDWYKIINYYRWPKGLTRRGSVPLAAPRSRSR